MTKLRALTLIACGLIASSAGVVRAGSIDFVTAEVTGFT